jgi:hypothetical protein
MRGVAGHARTGITRRWRRRPGIFFARRCCPSTLGNHEICFQIRRTLSRSECASVLAASSHPPMARLGMSKVSYAPPVQSDHWGRGQVSDMQNHNTTHADGPGLPDCPNCAFCRGEPSCGECHTCGKVFGPGVAPSLCSHATIVGGNDCRWCADCGADFVPHVNGLALRATPPADPTKPAEKP